jgi:hypothetical protein
VNIAVSCHISIPKASKINLGHIFPVEQNKKRFCSFEKKSNKVSPQVKVGDENCTCLTNIIVKCNSPYSFPLSKLYFKHQQCKIKIKVLKNVIRTIDGSSMSEKFYISRAISDYKFPNDHSVGNKFQENERLERLGML